MSDAELTLLFFPEMVEQTGKWVKAYNYVWVNVNGSQRGVFVDDGMIWLKQCGAYKWRRCCLSLAEPGSIEQARAFLGLPP